MPTSVFLDIVNKQKLPVWLPERELDPGSPAPGGISGCRAAGQGNLRRDCLAIEGQAAMASSEAGSTIWNSCPKLYPNLLLEKFMERTVEGSCSRLQEPELPHGFWCSPLRLGIR
jgi:hypothetical protein